MSRQTMLEQEGFLPVNVKVGSLVWLTQKGEGEESLVLLEHDTARTLAEYLLVAIPARQADVA